MGKRLENKVAIVVGAGQYPGDIIGNGRAISVLFAREGAKVLLVDRDIDSARETKTMIDQEDGDSVAFQADIVREDDCRNLVEKCIEVYGRIDILVNNVGIVSGDTRVDLLSCDTWDHIFNTNLRGMFLTCKYALPVMAKQESGVIINTSSISAVCTDGLGIASKVSKSGVNTLTRSLAMQYAEKGIRINAIMPGLMYTSLAIEMLLKYTGMSKEEIIEERKSQIPLKGKIGDAWDIANAALFLASDEAKFITSAILPVD
ncbi:MAG: SDR family oxidoreductase, partial [bacterium]|nr:SDR family oxidoreductase [bacterium]